jgi:hypothetical protein
MLLIGPAQADETAEAGTIITDVPGDRATEFILPVTITSDAGGGALAATVLPAGILDFAKLDEVEIVHGTSTAAVTITNSRGTVVWSLAAMDATANKIYGGHITTGIFPKKDTGWSLTTGNLDAADTVVIYFKFTKKQ